MLVCSLPNGDASQRFQNTGFNGRILGSLSKDFRVHDFSGLPADRFIIPSPLTLVEISQLLLAEPILNRAGFPGGH